MAQYDFGTIDPNTKSGTALASDLNSWRNALHSTHGGATAPSYLVAGMLWADTTSANYELKMYDGAQWIVIAVIDATNNVARVAVDPAETSYITSTTSGQIRHLIASADIFTIRSTGVQFNIAAPVIADSNNNELISFTTTASAVNQIGIANAATGGAATISAVGGDTNINIALTPKGTGVTQAITETAATNTIIDVARIEARSSGTPAAGIGAALLFAAETAASNFEIGARIEAVTTDVTAASEDFDLVFKTMAAGAAAAERMRIRSTGVVDVDALSIAGTTVTATAAELNILDGVTSTTAELNFVAGVTSAIQTQLNAKQDVLTGMVGFFAANTAPTGWLKANGALVSRTTYSALFAIIGTTFGVGDGSTTFALPDLRGEFPRGWDDARGVDSGRVFGSAQSDAFQGHWHGINVGATIVGNNGGGGVGTGNLRADGVGTAAQARAVVTNGTDGTPRTASETRPRNIALLACIKF